MIDIIFLVLLPAAKASQWPQIEADLSHTVPTLIEEAYRGNTRCPPSSEFTYQFRKCETASEIIDARMSGHEAILGPAKMQTAFISVGMILRGHLGKLPTSLSDMAHGGFALAFAGRDEEFT